MKNLKKIIVIFLTVFILFTGTAAFAEDAQTQQVDPNFKYVQAVRNYILQRYNGEITNEEILENALRKVIENHPELLEETVEGMFGNLDKYSTYFYEDQYEQFSTEVDGQFGGIGVRVMNKDGFITIVAPMENTPGQRAGLKSGDKIIYVDDTDVSKYDVEMAVPLLRGERGTSVKIGIKRDGNDEILYFNIVRDIIKINPISHNILNDSIGYIRISDFNANTNEYIEEALKELDDKNIKKLIIDLRYNPGGSLQQVVQVARHFVPDKGPIVHIEMKGAPRETYKSTLDKSKYELVVLINEGSASASEILAGAIQDSKAGKIIGAKSFGKGTVQEVLPLRIGGAIKMTIARYLTPSGKSIDGDGIHPDIEVKNILKKADIDAFEKLTFDRKPTTGDQGKDVLAAEQRLKLLGYDIAEPDEVFDQETFKAVQAFQTEAKLFSYGVLDLTTQMALNDAAKEVEVVVDKQMEKAIEVLSK